MPKRKDIVDNDSDDAVETPDELEEKQKKKAKVCGQKKLLFSRQPDGYGRPK